MKIKKRALVFLTLSTLPAFGMGGPKPTGVEYYCTVQGSDLDPYMEHIIYRGKTSANREESLADAHAQCKRLDSHPEFCSTKNCWTQASYN